MPAYVILDIDIHDPARYDDYKRFPQTVAPFGGRYLARGGAAETLEGDWTPGRMVIIEFPSTERARAWIESAEYREARETRAAAARSRTIVVEGL
ncbi:MAG: DUF1330 domain-containing protein [Gemmatimonadales bacterium]|nr:DUF1330 domain-containing protein [Gemmatimonadales bacterium]